MKLLTTIFVNVFKYLQTDITIEINELFNVLV